MKRLLVLLSLVMLSSLSCSTAGRQAPSSPSPPAVSSPAGAKAISDEEAVKDAGLDKEAVALVRKETSEPFLRLTGFNEDGREVEALGVTVKVSADGAEKTAMKLRPQLREIGFISYMTDVMGDDKDRITVVKGTDPYEILRIKNTDGINYGHTNAQVIAKLKEWEKRYPFTILGASMDWVQLELAGVPPDCDDFAKEVYHFCPDIVDQGTGSVGELAQEIRKSRRLFLWWD